MYINYYEVYFFGVLHKIQQVCKTNRAILAKHLQEEHGCTAESARKIVDGDHDHLKVDDEV